MRSRHAVLGMWVVGELKPADAFAPATWWSSAIFYTWEAALHYANLRAVGVMREVATREAAFFDRTALMKRAEAYRRGAVATHARAQRRMDEALAEVARANREIIEVNGR